MTDDFWIHLAKQYVLSQNPYRDQQAKLQVQTGIAWNFNSFQKSYVQENTLLKFVYRFFQHKWVSPEEEEK